MTLESLLTVLRERGIRLWAEGDDLRYAAPTGALDDQLITAIRARKAEILAYLRRAVAMPRRHETIPRVARGSEPLRPSFAQQRLWFLDQLQPEANAYCWSIVLRLRGRLDVDALEFALATIYQRHEVLRARFHDVEGKLHVRIDDASRLELHRLDLPGDDDQARADAAHRTVNAEVQRPFDLTRGPLVRAHVMRINREDHVLLLAMHHIVSDGWSLGVLNDELGALYRAFTQGEPSPLPPLAVQYADFAAWQRQWLSGEVGKKQLQYWRSQLASLAPLELPTDRLRPTRQSFGAKSTKVTLPKQVSEAIAALGRDVGATPFMTLFAAFAALLRRYTGQDDIVVGSPIANRNRVEIEPLIGFFVNSLVLRADLAGDPTFRELLARVRTVAIDAFEHQDIPFEQLVQELHPERDLGRNPLFQVSFIVQNAGESALTLPGIEVSHFDRGAPTTGFDIELHVTQCQDALKVNFIYNTDLFDTATIERMARRYCRLLEEAAAAPDRAVNRLSILDAGERRQTVVEWNDTAASYPDDTCIHEQFEAYAAQTPNAIAVEFEGESLTYDAMNRRANQVAHHLIDRGVGPETNVGLCVERSLDMVVGILGILKAGGAYVPLDLNYPEARLAYLVEDAGIQTTLTQADLREKIPSGAGELICLDADWPAIQARPQESPAVEISPDALAYVIYTSGSTGQPKGVMVTHAASCNQILAMRDELQVTADDRLLQKTPLSFDVSVLEIFLPLAAGARLVVARPDGHRDPEYLAETIVRRGITVIHFVPSMLRTFLEVADLGSCPSLTRVMCGGEVLALDLVNELRTDSAIRLFNCYGPTEATVGVTTCRCEPRENETTVPLGRPIANTRLYILDGAMNPVPIGAVGELHIAGIQLARGYLGRPALTAERFVPDPFNGAAGARLYRTGDLARYRADGNIEFLGRADHQVKLRGYRIEPAEIESLLTEHADVRQAVAMVREDRAGRRRLVSYVVGTPGRVPSPAELKSWMKGRVPEYMVPSAFVTLDALPLTPSGKVDRKKLPALDGATLGVGTEYVAPRSGTEEVLCAIWADVLGVEHIGVHDDFFDLGGHSLLATQVVSRVRQVSEVELPLQAMFDDPTVERLAAIVQGAGANAPDAPPIVPLPRDGDLPLSFAQQRLWFLDELHQGSAGYNLPISLRLRGQLDRSALQRSLDELVRRHETLRTTFHSRDGVPWQSILAPAPVPVRLVDMTDRPAETRAAAAQQTVQHEVSQPFDLSAGAPMRALLMRLADDEHVLLLTLHHIVTDGWSFGVLKRELGAIYAAFTQGKPSPLAPLAIQYADFGAWQRERLDGALGAEQLQYWKSELAELSPLELPTDHPRPAKQTFRAGRVQIVLPKDLSKAIHVVSRTSGATPFMTLLAAFAAMLGRYAGQDDIVVGTPIANRNHVDIEPLVGFFVNTLVMRTDLSGQPTFRELISRVRRTALGAYAHQDLPFEHLVEDLHPERDLARSPIFQVLFAMQNVDATALTLPGLETSAFAIEVGSTRLDFELWVALADDELVANVVYNADLFDASTIERMSRHYHNLLEAIVADPDQLVDSLAILDQAERDDLVVTRNRTEAKVAELSVPELVHRTAADRPDATAVVFEGARLTYAQLDAQAGQLARDLLELGVGRGDRVGLCVDRSPAMLIGLLGVQKTGAAYVPIDPGLPAERLRFMLEDAGVAAIVTTDVVRERLAIIAEHDAPIVSLDAIRLSKSSAAETDLPRVRPDDVAYVIYTSGSTGRPKGVEVLHRGVVNFLESMRVEPGFDESDVLLAVTTLSFDIAVLELLLPLSCGGTVIIAPADSVSDGEAVGGLLDEHGVTVMQATPATWQLLLQSGWSGRPSLKMLCGGEALPRSLANALIERGGELWNMYGPTETTIWSATTEIHAGDESISIGHPIANTQLYVVDARGGLVPDGAVGELCIGGDGVARGYLDRPDLTADRFVVDPFRDAPGARLYRTGDLVRYDVAGRLQFLGRVDHQIKLRGFRIELGEIESALVAHDAIAQAAVLLMDEGTEQSRIVAFVVSEAGLTPTEMREHLSRGLPDYMVPAAFVKLDAMPLSPAGKIDRRQLAEIEVEAAPEVAYVAPRDPVEVAVADEFATLLQRSTVGAHDDFFRLGGHSLLATRLVSRLREAFRVELPLSAIFADGTVAGIAKHIEMVRRSAEPATILPPIERVSRDERPALSFAQQRMWFLDQLGVSSAYNVGFSLRYDGRLDHDLVHRALAAVVQRHEVLRTSFPDVDGHAYQRIVETIEVPITFVDVSHLSPEAGAAQARDHAGADYLRPFDFVEGPPLRAAIVRMRDDDALIITVHHIACDGWSLQLLRREIVAHYDALARGVEPDVPALPVQYADYADWQRKHLDESALQPQMDYWCRQLEGELPVLDLPTDRPRPAVQTFNGASKAIVITPALYDAIHRFMRDRGVTAAMTTLAAFKVLLSRYTGLEDVVVGSPIAGRTRGEIEELIGFFVNSLVMRTDLSGRPSFGTVLERVQQVALEAYDHPDLPFERLVDELDPERDLGHNPLFQIVFAMQNAVDAPAAETSGFTAFPTRVTVTRTDIELHLFETHDAMSGMVVYNTDLFDETTIERMIEHFLRLLEAAIAEPDVPIAALPMLSDAEQERVLETWNDTQAPYEDDRCIHELFEARAAEAPDAIAVVAGSVELSYGELNARANQLAHGLRARGVGPDTLVGLCADRSADMIIGLLGIQKAGGAYVPLDPTYPRERLAYMLEDSGVRVLLTQAPLLASLPPYDGETLCLDRDWSLFEGESTENPAVVTCPDNLAYAIYTSGSTGRPKGTLLAHRGLVSLSAEQGRAFGAGPGSRVLQFSSLSFDACTFEITMALPKGATLFLGEREELMPGPDLLAFIRTHEISIVTLPPTALAALPVEPLPSLRTITVAGEACSSDLVSRWAPGRQFFNLYGPTEATIWSTTAELRAGETAHIGRPNGNVQVYLLDAHGQPVPVGVPGELHVGGISVARGYLDRPALTAERFVPDPFGPVAGGRLYRTGDLVRYRADGNIEFLGRIDEQVKLRGYRIELGEIESVLDEHPAVFESVAIVREDIKDDRRLVAYVTCDESVELVTPETGAAEWQDEHVAQWQTLYDQSYADNQEPAEAAFNIAGWNSSYTGEPIPPEEMREWVNNTVARIRSTGPEHVLEMGCGSGLLLLNTVPHVVEYVGADFSQPALDYVARQLERMGDDGAKGRVECRTADNFDGLPKGHFDTVVLNSVVQYFPDAEYLRRVLEGAVAAVRPGGRVFVGDVRSLPLLRAFHASVQLEQAPIETTREQLERRVQHEMNQDQELVIDPAFFTALAADIDGISHVELEPKRGRYDNELSRFRYDVIVHVAGGAANGSMAELDWRTWDDAGLTLPRLRMMLAEEQPATLALSEVPNLRVARDVEIAAMIDESDAPGRVATLRTEVDARSGSGPGVEPDDLRRLAEELGYDVHVSLTAARPDGSYDVVLARRADNVPAEAIWRAMPISAEARSDAEVTNRPLRGRFLRELVPQLREHASARLPEYMVPSVFTVMDRFPLTPNGKVDRRALPAPDALRPELAVAYEAPRSEQEETLARIWVQVLGVDRVGAHDNFFELGGDSMLSIQVVAMAREAGIGISARDLFQLQTVAELAAAAGAATATAEQGVVTGDVPLTPIMQWFFEQDLSDAHHFNQAFMIAAETPFDAGEVEAVLGHLAAHHDALRQRARHADEGWTLTLVEPGDRVPVDVVDLSAVAPAEQPALVEREAARVQAGLDLTNGPLIRCAIFRGGASDDGRGERLLVVVHHLAVDVVSWGVLLDDLARTMKQRRADQPWRLPAKTTSIREWASRLDEYAQSAEVAADAAYWSGLPWSKAGAFPIDHAQGVNTIDSVRSVPVVLDEEQTRAVLHEVPGAFNATVEDVLLAALAIACAAEMKTEWTLVDLEGHGREEFADDLDVSRTVGWFTSIHPVLLHAEPGASPGAVMRTVKEQLRAVPGNGTAFGLARYLARDAGLSDRMRTVPDAPIAFNYLGRLDQMTNRDDEWNVSTRDVGPSRSERGVRRHLLEVSGAVMQGRLRIGFGYSSAVHQEATIKRLADRCAAALIELIDASRTGDERGYTVSDLAEVGWNAEDVSDLLSDLEGNL